MNVLLRAFCLFVMFWLHPGQASAQVAELIGADDQGDFHTVTVQSARGNYPQRFWLIVDQDPRGLICRDSSGRALIALRRGAVVETDPLQHSPPRMPWQAKPYVRVRVKPVDLLLDARLHDRGRGGSCLVRANTAFITPILEDSLLDLPLRP